MTKRHEKNWLTTLDEAIEWYEANDARGEYVLVLEGADEKALEEERQAAWDAMSIEDHMDLYLAKGQSKRSDEIGCRRPGNHKAGRLSVSSSG